MAVDVTAGQKPSIWSTGLIGNTALCRHNNYDGHLRAESRDFANFENFANKVTGCRDRNRRLSPTEIKYLFGASGMQNVFIFKDAKYCILVILSVPFKLLNQHIKADTYSIYHRCKEETLNLEKIFFFTFTFVIILLTNDQNQAQIEIQGF